MSIGAVQQNYCGDFFNKVSEVATQSWNWVSETSQSVYERLQPHLEKLADWFKENSSFVWTAAITAGVTLASTIACALYCCPASAQATAGAATSGATQQGSTQGTTQQQQQQQGTTQQNA
ncbi:MAG: hypothetical protein Tsb0015_04050 [Simkaniaceae bacterium]